MYRSAYAHNPGWNIPTYAYISISPNPDGVGQSVIVYMWLDCVYGAAGGTAAAVGTNGYTASAALLSNNYRFSNYQLTITGPDGKNTTQTFPNNIRPYFKPSVSNFTPSQVGTYTLFFLIYPGQVYGANGDGYSGSLLINDTYLPRTTQRQPSQCKSSPIPAANRQFSTSIGLLGKPSIR